MKTGGQTFCRKGVALELLPHVAGTLCDGGAELQILLSRDFVEAQFMTRQALEDAVDVLAVMGGDGCRRPDGNTDRIATKK